MVRVVFSLIFVVVLGTGCGSAKLVDCEKLAADNAACVDDDALASCQAENTECEAAGAGEVLVLESCPLQFSCSLPRDNTLPE
jgi:hypothetical protein